MAPSVVGGLLEIGGMVVSVQYNRVFWCGTHMLIVNADNVEVLVEAVSRHPVEVGEQHAVAVVHIVE